MKEELGEEKIKGYTLRVNEFGKFALIKENSIFAVYGDIIGDWLELGVQLYPRIWSLLQFQIEKVHEDEEYIYLVIKMLHLNKMIIAKCGKEYATRPNRILHIGKVATIYDIEELKRLCKENPKFTIYSENEKYLVFSVEIILYDEWGDVYRHTIDVTLKKLKLNDKEIGIEKSINLYKAALPGSLRDISEDILGPEYDLMRERGVILA
ncbi:MAG: hypothetical protein ACXQTW_07525 [Candidatus Methanospirareceae archaeon]